MIIYPILLYNFILLLTNTLSRFLSFADAPTTYSRIDIHTIETRNDKMSLINLSKFKSSTPYTTRTVRPMMMMLGKTNLPRYVLTLKDDMQDLNMNNLMM